MFAQSVDNLKGRSIEKKGLSIEHKGPMARIRDIVLAIRMSMEELGQNPIMAEILRRGCDYNAQKGDPNVM